MPFGARIQKIDGKDAPDLVPGAPAGALTVVGGQSVATSKGGSYKDIFRWGETLADCRGEERPGGRFVTTVTSSILNFEAVNRPIIFKAARLANTVVSSHSTTDKQPTITPTQILLEGLELDGKPIQFEPHLEKDLQDFPTFDAFQNEFNKRGGFFERHLQVLKGLVGAAGTSQSLPRNSAGLVQFSVVHSFTYGDQKIQGNVLSLKGFGNIHFAEVLMNENNRRFTLLRLELGCSVDAQAACSETDPNGTFSS